jgi:hypothetical protein
MFKAFKREEYRPHQRRESGIFKPSPPQMVGIDEVK